MAVDCKNVWIRTRKHAGSNQAYRKIKRQNIVTYIYNPRGNNNDNSR